MEYVTSSKLYLNKIDELSSKSVFQHLRVRQLKQVRRYWRWIQRIMYKIQNSWKGISVYNIFTYFRKNSMIDKLKGRVVFSSYGEEALIAEAIFADYSKHSRPVGYGDEVINVGIQFLLAKIEKSVSVVWASLYAKWLMKLLQILRYLDSMMRPRHGNVFILTGSVWGESNSQWGVPLTKSSNVKLHFFCSTASAVEQTVEWSVMWDATTFMWRLCRWRK